MGTCSICGGSHPTDGHVDAESPVRVELELGEDGELALAGSPADDPAAAPLADPPNGSDTRSVPWMPILAGLVGLWLLVALISSFRSEATPAAATPLPATEATATPEPTEAPIVLAEPDPAEVANAAAEVEAAETESTPELGFPDLVAAGPRLIDLRGNGVGQLSRRGSDARIAYIAYQGLVIVDLATRQATVLPLTQEVDPGPGTRLLNFGNVTVAVFPELLFAAVVDVPPMSLVSDDETGTVFELDRAASNEEESFVSVLGVDGEGDTYTFPSGFTLQPLPGRGFMVEQTDGVVLQVPGSDGLQVIAPDGKVLTVSATALLVERCAADPDGPNDPDACSLVVAPRVGSSDEELVLGNIDQRLDDEWVLSQDGSLVLQARRSGRATLFHSVDGWSTTLFDRGVGAPAIAPDGDLIAWFDLEEQIDDDYAPPPLVDELRLMAPETRDWYVINLGDAGLPSPIFPQIAIW